MLRQLRSQRTMKTTMWIVAGAFAVGFLFLGQGLKVGGGSSNQANLAAVVNGVEISYEAYSTRVNQMAESERSRSGRDELSTAEYERLENQAWDDMVTEILVSQEAKRLGLRAADDEVAAYLMNNPPSTVRQSFLDEEGNFDAAAYQRALNDPQFDWRPAEAYVRAILPTLKVQQMVAARATVSENEIRQEFARRTVHQTVRYVGLRWGDVETAQDSVSDDELRQFHSEHPELFGQGEQVILEAIRIDKKPSAEDEADLRHEASQMLEELENGTTANFADLAGIYSEDPSATRGGEVGWIRRGYLPPAVEEAAWNLEPGAHTAPITTERGIYVVEVDSVRTDRDGAREIFLRQLVLKMEPSRDTLDSLRTLAYEVHQEAKHDLQGPAKKYGLSVETLQPLQGGNFVPGFGFSQRLHDWAFAAKPGAVGGPFGNDETILIPRVVEHQPAGLEPFEGIRERVRTAYLENRKKEAVRSQLESFLQALHAGSTFEQAAKAQGWEVKTPETFTYYQNVPDVGAANEFTAAAASLAPGETSGVVETSLAGFVLQLQSREPFDEAAYKEARPTHERTLMERRVNEIFQAWLSDLRESAKIDDRRPPRV